MMRATVLLLLLLLASASNAFVLRPAAAISKSTDFQPVSAPFSPARSLTVVQRMAKDDDKPKAAPTAGGGRGLVLFGFVLLVNVWLFSVPPSFRRAYICPTPRCEQNRPACKDCVTGEEWKNGIVDYYRNGGGIQFDFSIDPATLEANKQSVEALLGGKK